MNLKLAITNINTLKTLYYKFMLRNSINNFVDLITISEQVEKGIKKRKIANDLVEAINLKKANVVGKKKENEVHAFNLDKH